MFSLENVSVRMFGHRCHLVAWNKNHKKGLADWAHTGESEQSRLQNYNSYHYFMSHHHEDPHAQRLPVFPVLFCPVLARFRSDGFCVFCSGSLSFAVKLSNLLPLSCLKSGAQWGWKTAREADFSWFLSGMWGKICALASISFPVLL